MSRPQSNHSNHNHYHRNYCPWRPRDISWDLTSSKDSSDESSKKNRKSKPPKQSKQPKQPKSPKQESGQSQSSQSSCPSIVTKYPSRGHLQQRQPQPQLQQQPQVQPQPQLQLQPQPQPQLSHQSQHQHLSYTQLLVDLFTAGEPKRFVERLPENCIVNIHDQSQRIPYAGSFFGKTGALQALNQYRNFVKILDSTRDDTFWNSDFSKIMITLTVQQNHRLRASAKTLTFNGKIFFMFTFNAKEILSRMDIYMETGPLIIFYSNPENNQSVVSAQPIQSVQSIQPIQFIQPNQPNQHIQPIVSNQHYGLNAFNHPINDRQVQ